MTGLREWQAQVVAYREAGLESEDEAWERAAMSYQKLAAPEKDRLTVA